MNENKSKTHKEIFQEKYPAQYLKETAPLGAAEALGYLKCLQQFLPTDKWIEEYKTLMLTMVSVETLKGIFNGEDKH